MLKKTKGIWLYGASGSGKTFISKLIKKKLKKTFLIDGDVVRKNISFDLKYNLSDRIIQTKRLLGLSRMCVDQKYFPIISSVYIGKDIALSATRNKILIISVIRERRYLNQKLKNKKTNVVGKDIKQPKINCVKLENNKYIVKNINSLLKKIK